MFILLSIYKLTFKWRNCKTRVIEQI